MTKKVSGFVTIKTVQGELIAHVMKTRLESEGIPVLLQYESVSQVYGILIDGLGEVHILVPQALAEEAKQILEEESSLEEA
jgi:phage major head subunit gpT-like protein